MHEKALWVVYVIFGSLLPAQAFHPENAGHVDSFQCIACNASYYCSAGERYPCHANSLAAVAYADKAEECICNPGHVLGGKGLPLTYDFTSNFHPVVWYSDYAIRLNLWLSYAASIGATTSIADIGHRGGNADGFGYTGVIFGGGDMTKGSNTFQLPLSMDHNHVKVVYRTLSDYGYIHSLYIGGVLRQNCSNTKFKPPCVFETTYTAGQVLKIEGRVYQNRGLYLGENLQIFFTHSNPSYSCNLGLAPSWYLYGQKNSCPATKAVATNGSGSVEDCVCLPGYASQGPGVFTACSPCPAGTFADKHNMSQCTQCPENSWHTSTQQTNISACLCHIGFSGTAARGCGVCMPGYATLGLSTACSPCPAGTFADEHNMSQCTPCPANSWHTSTKQTNISACLCNAGWAGVAASGCVECAAGTFTAANGSAVCQICRNNSDTYDQYPRTICQCHQGFFDFVTQNMLSSNVRALRDQPYHLLVTSTPSWGWTSAGRLPLFFAQGGYYNNAFLRFSKTSATSGHNYIGPSGGSVGFTNGITIVFVVRLQSTLTISGGMDSAFVSFQRNDEHHALSLNLRMIGGIWNMCLSTYSGETCARADAPLNTWIKFFYTYHPNASPRGNVQVEYTSSSGAVIVWKATNNKIENDFATRKIVFGTSVSNNCAAYYSHIQLYESQACDRPIFDTAGFYFIPALASNSDINAIYKAIANGVHLKDLPLQDSCKQCNTDSFKDYIGNLRASDIVCPSCDPNAKSPVASVSVSACLCQNGFYDDRNNTCQQCTSGKYKAVAANHTEDLELCQLCPANTTSKAQSARIEDCICIPGYSGPNGGPCVACELGKYKGINGSSSCIDCPLHTWADKTNMTECNSCQTFLQSPGGATESVAETSSESCFCRPGYITNGTTSCSPCPPAYYSLVKNLAECTACPEHTYTDPVLFPWNLTTDCIVCQLCNNSTKAAFVDHYDAARGGLGCGEKSVEVCTQCPSGSSLFLPTNESQRNFGVRSCVCDVHFYGIVGTACAACPSNQVRPEFIYANTTLAACLCAPGFEPDPAAKNLCRQCPIGTYKQLAGDDNCTDCPDIETTELPGNLLPSACVCEPGYVFDSDSEKCTICPENTHKVGYNKYTTCNACTANSFGAAGRTGPWECSCSANFEANPHLCALCKAGKYKNESTTIKVSNELFVASQTINLARACIGGNCPVSVSSWWGGDFFYHGSKLVDGDLSLGNTFQSSPENNPWVRIDMQTTVHVSRVRIYNRGDCCQYRLDNFEIRVGNDLTFPSNSNNAVCVTSQPTFVGFKDFTCTLSGRYISLQVLLNSAHLMFREFEVYGTKEAYTYESANEWKTDVVSTGTVLGRCSACPQNTVTNNTGVLVCEACAAGKTTDRRTGQVECVCDVGTEPDADGECVTCREGRYKATTTDKYANRACVNCSSCGANQQVASECNSTLDVKCLACQANSWSLAGRKLLEPCLCNAGYELQGQLCVACPVGKARQVNNNNSILCETCNSTTFTSVSATVSCGACSPVCADICPEIIYDFSKVALGQPWKDYAAAIGFPSQSMFGWSDFCGGYMGQWNNGAFIQGTLPAGYTYLEVTFYGACAPVALSIGGVTQATSYGNTVVYQQKYSAGQTLRLQEFSPDQQGGIGKNLKIRLYNPCTILYVKNECNASRDVICQQCQRCGLGFYDNNTCGINYDNDRLDTQCPQCPEGFYCPGGSVSQVAFPCAAYGCPANQQVATLCNATHNVTCRACQANSWTPAGRTKLEPCLCNAGYELQGELCVACPVGKARQANYNNSIVCEVCAAATFTSVSTSITCGACSQDCPDPTFPAINLARACSAGGCPVTSSLSVDSSNYGGFRVVDGITTIQNLGFISFITDTPWLMIDLEKTVYVWMVRLYNRPDCCQERLTNFEIRVGSSSTFANNPACASNQPSFNPSKDFPCVLSGRYLSVQLMYTSGTSSLGVGEVEVYGYTRQDHLPPAVMERRYVKHECNASRDGICEECQTCGPMFYANNTCGANYSNDRLDTQCVLCPAGSYCPGGNVSQLAIPCPDNGKSPPGSVNEKACDCDPGFFRDVDGCSLCVFDAYCPGKQVQTAVSCPPMSRTMERGSTVRLDCHCARGYFRDPPSDEVSFNCSLCLPGDFCFNNSAYNCSDPLMESEPGSGFVDNCTCASRFYNNGSRCDDCPRNSYCVNGLLLGCPENEWTAGIERGETCLCKPGFFRPAGTEVCVPCSDDFFCDGTDDARHACPSNAIAKGAVGREQCLCNVSFGAVFSDNASQPHSCDLCAHTETYKGSVSNSACLQCTECLPQQHSSWTQIECTPRANALCDTCSVCYNATEGGPRSQYTTQACQQFFDTECGNCSVCEWEREWELSPCSETDDTACADIAFDRECPVGFYAGGHTRVTDSRCLPCAVRNAPYEGQWLHEFTSAGREYDNRFSCETTCRAFSRLANVSDVAAGCTTCEVGNVLFKLFTQDMSECRFTCLGGYVRVGGDCVLGATEGDEFTFWNHSLNVTHVQRETQRNNSGRGAFLVTVSHTAHGHFAVVVGATEPTCGGRSPITLRRTEHPACCFEALWRVSTPNQLGLASDARESCSRSNAPWSARLSDTQLQFEIPDDRLAEMAQCQHHLGALECVAQVSIVDTVLRHHVSVSLRLELRRGAALATTSTTTYIPLASFRAEAQLAYREADGSPVFIIVSDMTPLPGAGATDVLLLSTGLLLVQPPAAVNCRRYAVELLELGHSVEPHTASVDVWTLHTAPVRATSFLRAPHGTEFIKLFYTLRLRERESQLRESATDANTTEANMTKNTMHIAVWRNLSTEHPVCEDPAQPQVVSTGQVLSCGGLGDFAVAAATALQHPTETVHGEVGGLTSFVARALHAHVREVHASSMLLAFALPPLQLGVNITSMHMGVLGFTDEFRALCQASSLCHLQHVHRGSGMHLMSSCDAASQDAARAWLRLSLGVVHDAGHVMALCRLAHRQSAHEYPFLITLVNTRAYLPRARQWHDLQNHSALVSTSSVAAVFEFV